MDSINEDQRQIDTARRKLEKVKKREMELAQDMKARMDEKEA